METRAKEQPRHLGKKISRVRELLGIKQETLAERLGITQQAISRIEQSEQIEDATLERIAKALGVSSEVIKTFTEENTVNFIINSFHDNSVNQGANFQPVYNINPVEKWLAALEDNKRLQEENKHLYEELLKSEREKITMLEKLLKERK